jgi:pyridoxine/pyridoxamine 5'-phosphate oxidase
MDGRKRRDRLAEPAERGRPHAPGYGIRTDAKGLLPWSFVEERMAAAREYWVATVDPDGRPHLTPVWGLWVDGVFYFGSGPRTRKARNLAENPNVAVHPEGDDVVILEGVAEVVTDPDPALSERVYAASAAKYGMGSHSIDGSYAVRPRVAFAWTGSGLTQTAISWVFGND